MEAQAPPRGGLAAAAQGSTLLHCLPGPQVSSLAALLHASPTSLEHRSPIHLRPSGDGRSCPSVLGGSGTQQAERDSRPSGAPSAMPVLSGRSRPRLCPGTTGPSPSMTGASGLRPGPSAWKSLLLLGGRDHHGGRRVSASGDARPLRRGAGWRLARHAPLCPGPLRALWAGGGLRGAARLRGPSLTLQTARPPPRCVQRVAPLAALPGTSGPRLRAGVTLSDRRVPPVGLRRGAGRALVDRNVRARWCPARGPSATARPPRVALCGHLCNGPLKASAHVCESPGSTAPNWQTGKAGQAASFIAGAPRAPHLHTRPAGRGSVWPAWSRPRGCLAGGHRA